MESYQRNKISERETLGRQIWEEKNREDQLREINLGYRIRGGSKLEIVNKWKTKSGEQNKLVKSGRGIWTIKVRKDGN